MGASSPGLVGMVLANGLKLTAIGLGLGLAMAVALSRLLSTLLHGLLFEISNTDWITFSIVPLVLLAVSSAACLIPAYRASRVHPVQALRYE